MDLGVPRVTALRALHAHPNDLQAAAAFAFQSPPGHARQRARTSSVVNLDTPSPQRTSAVTPPTQPAGTQALRSLGRCDEVLPAPYAHLPAQHCSDSHHGDGLVPVEVPARAPGADWRAFGPPTSMSPHETRSWCYVPLLLCAAGFQHTETSEQWAHHPVAGIMWSQLVALLQQSPAAPLMSLCAVAAALAEVRATASPRSSANSSFLNMLDALAAEATYSPSLTLHMAVRLSACSDSYLPALAQETLLQVFGGDAVVPLLHTCTHTALPSPWASPCWT